MLRPLNQFVAVHPEPYKPPSTIEVVELSENLMLGEVLATGPGKRLKGNKVRPMCVKTGQHVLFRLRSARAWHDPKFSRDVLLIEEDDVLGIQPEAACKPSPPSLPLLRHRGRVRASIETCSARSLMCSSRRRRSGWRSEAI